MNRRLANRITLVAAVLIVMAGNAAASSYTYSFSGEGQVTPTLGPVSFSFTEPSLLTTTGGFSFTPFTIGTTTFGYGYLSVSGASDCFIFGVSGTSSTSCTVFDSVKANFGGTFTGATSPGTYTGGVPGFCNVGGSTSCILLTSVTISTASTAVPEPSCLMLVGTGALALLGAIRRKLG